VRSAMLLVLLLAAPAARAQTPDPAPAGARLTLAQAIALATAGHPAVTLAGLRAQEAAARVGQSRAALLPSLGASAFESNRTVNLETFGFSFPSPPGAPAIPDRIGPFDVVDARLRASQSILDLPAWAKLAASRRGLEASRGDQAVAAEATAQAAAVAYLRAARAEALQRARAADVDLAQLLVGLAEAQVKAGVSPALDLTRARTQLAATRGAFLLATNQVGRARIDLARALGLDPATRFELADTLSEGVAGSSAPQESLEALAQARARRPELRAERARVLKAEGDRDAIRAERLPRLDVAADYGASGQHFPEAFPTRELSISASLPLFDGLRRERRVAEQEGLMAESQVRVTDLGRQVEAEVEAALLDLDSGRLQQKVADEQLGLAEQEVAEARDRFSNGVAGSIEVVNAQASLVRARDVWIEARFTTALARVGLARAVGMAASLR